MTCTKSEARAWIKNNWHDLCERRELSFVLKRYYAVYNGRCEQPALTWRGRPADDYVRLKRELEKLPIDK